MFSQISCKKFTIMYKVNVPIIQLYNRFDFCDALYVLSMYSLCIWFSNLVKFLTVHHI